METAGIDATRQMAHMAETLGGEFVVQLSRWHQRRLRAVVEASQPGEHQRRQKAGAIVRDEVVEARVEAGGRGNTERFGSCDRGPTERAFGRHVHRLRRVLAPHATQLGTARQAEAQPGVTWQRGAPHQVLAHAARQRRGFGGGLTRARQQHLVAQRRQLLDEVLHGQCDAVDLGRIGLGDNSDAHALSRFREHPHRSG
jgi:hypothetical protein